MNLLLVLLVLVISTLVAVFIASQDFNRHVLRHVRGATYSRNDMELERTGLGLAIGGGVFFATSACVALLVQAAFGSSSI